MEGGSRVGFNGARLAVVVLLIALLGFASFKLVQAKAPITLWNKDILSVNQVAISPDGRYVAVVNRPTLDKEVNELHLLDEFGNELWNVRVDGDISNLEVAEDGKYVVLGTKLGAKNLDPRVMLFDSKGSQVWTIRAKDVLRVGISKGGEYVVAQVLEAVERNEILNVFVADLSGAYWKFSDRYDVANLPAIGSGSISPDGSLVLIGSKYGQSMSNNIFFNKDGFFARDVTSSNNDVVDTAISPDKKMSIILEKVHPTKSKLFLIDNAGLTLNKVIEINESAFDVAFSKDGSRFSVAGRNKVYTFDNAGVLIKTDETNLLTGVPQTGDVKIASSAHDRYVFVGSDGKTYYVRADRPRLIVLANSIDYQLAGDLFDYLEGRGIEVVQIKYINFDAYKNEKFILILGGPEAPEGVGSIVREALLNSEQNALRNRGAKMMYVKTNVWAAGQKVVVIAGSGRDQTKEAHQGNRGRVVDETPS